MGSMAIKRTLYLLTIAVTRNSQTIDVYTSMSQTVYVVMAASIGTWKFSFPAVQIAKEKLLKSESALEAAECAVACNSFICFKRAGIKPYDMHVLQFNINCCKVHFEWCHVVYTFNIYFIAPTYKM